jgi:two-component system, NtrC family, nitrogen regulation response regulator NtrX
MNNKKATILLLDDELDIVEFLGRILEREGYEVLGAGNSDEALKVFNSEHPDICILDIHLPDSKIDGVGVLEQIRKKNSETICIMYSRMTDDDHIRKANELNVHDFLVKPVEPQRVKESIARGIELIKARKE